MKLILIGRSGSGKTSVIESLLGSTIFSEGNTQTVTRFGPPVVIAKTLGFFSGKHDLHACTMKLAQCVYSFNPGPDAFGLVIPIGRFTAEERNMIDIFQEMYGKEVCQFTIIIFTRLDDLLYDDVPLDEFLKDSSQELRDLLARCGGRYIAFDNSGSWESRKGYAESLVSMMKILQTQNKNTVYTVEMLEKAKFIQMKKEKEESKQKEESHRQLKEEMKVSMRQELQAQIMQDITVELMKEDQERRMMVQIVPGKDRGKQKQRDQLMSLQMPIRMESARQQPDHSSLRNQFDLPKLKVEHQTSCDTKLILVGRSGSGKSSVIESLMGSPLSSKSQTQAVNRFGSSILIAETLGFFSPDHDLQTCEMKLAECVYSFNPGPHAFGLVIRIGRFTAEEIKMINIFRETYGEDVFRFTIIIFTRLDDLLYDGVPLDEFLKHCTPELGNLLSRCGGRYVGFDNSGTWEARKGYAEALVSMMKMLQTQNKNSIYTWNMLEKAKVIQMKKEEELKQKEESRRQLKEEMKASMTQELQEQIRQDITVKLMKEDQEQRMMVRTARGKEADTTMQHGKLISCKNLVHEEKTHQHSSPQNLSNVSKVNMDEQLTRQQLKPPRPIAEGTRKKPIVYTKQKDQSGVFTEHKAESSSPKKEKTKPKPRGPKPELKPKPGNLKKKKGNKSVRVCKRCFELNPPAEAYCKFCGASQDIESQEKPEERVPRCMKCNAEMNSPQESCQNCNKKPKEVARVNPVPKPPPDSIMSQELRIVLIGKTGAGKSSTANTILNEKVFASRASMKSVTEKCQYVRRDRWGRKVLLIDTPGLFDTQMSKDVIAKEITKSVAISSPGPHAFLLVTSLSNRFTKEEQDVLKELDGMFGQHMMKYLIVIFTGRDQIGKESPNEYVNDSPEELKKVLKSACGGYITFNNRGKDPEKEVDARKLFERIEEMVKANGGDHFTSEMFKEAEEVMQNRIARELEMREQDLRREIEEELRAEMEEKLRKEREYFQTLHEADVLQMNQMKLELKAEKEKSSTKLNTGRESEMALEELILEEIEKSERKNNLILQIEKTEGAERVRMQHQLADVGEQIKQIKAKRKAAEEEVTKERVSTAIVLQSQVLRDEERQKVEQEDENALASFKRGIKNFGTSFMKLFR